MNTSEIIYALEKAQAKFEDESIKCDCENAPVMCAVCAVNNALNMIKKDTAPVENLNLHDTVILAAKDLGATYPTIGDASGKACVVDTDNGDVYRIVLEKM